MAPDQLGNRKNHGRTQPASTVLNFRNKELVGGAIEPKGLEAIHLQIQRSKRAVALQSRTISTWMVDLKAILI